MFTLYTAEDIKQGSEKAFESVYIQYKDKLYYWLLGKMKSEYWAQEVLQQTFVKCWVTRHNLSAELAIDIQLFRIARSLMIDQARKLANEKKLAAAPPAPETDNSLLNTYQAKETQQEIDRIVESMPEVGKKAFRLSREYGLTYLQIAEELSISPKTVEYHISRTLTQLRKVLAPMLAIFFR